MFLKSCASLLFVILICNEVNLQHTDDYTESEYISPLHELVVVLLENLVMHMEYSECRFQLKQLLNSITEKEEWALQMLDAFAKPQMGFLSGNVMHIGNFDECLSISKTVDEIHIQGKYCALLLTNLTRKTNESYFPLSSEEGVLDSNKHLALRFSYGICIPKACTKEEFTYLWQHMKHIFEIPADFKFLEELCYFRGSSNALDLPSVCMLTVLGSFALLIAISTMNDVFLHYGGHDTNFLNIFSFRVNCQQMFRLKREPNYIKCLDGIRAVSMMWVIYAHGFIVRYSIPNVNTINVLTEAKRNPMNTIVTSSTFAADTFLTVSGFLVVQTFLHSLESEDKTNVFKFLLRRIIRLVPSLAVAILLYASLYDYLGDGPFWIVVNYYIKRPCAENWMSTLLFIQNYHDSHKQCIPQAWYLAVDTQLYLLSPIFLIPLLRWPKNTLCLMCSVIIASALGGFIVTWYFDLDSLFLQASKNFDEYVYYPTHMRMGPWLIGAILGYVIFSIRYKKLRLNKVIVASLWLGTIILVVVIIFGHIGFTGYPYNKYRSSLFNALARDAWSLCIAWVIFACISGNGRVINSFLSARVFGILVPLNYSMFLLHLLVILHKEAQGRIPGYFITYTQLHNFLGDYAVTVLVSFLWTILFEMPFVTLYKYLFPKKVKIHEERRNSLPEPSNIHVS